MSLLAVSAVLFWIVPPSILKCAPLVTRTDASNRPLTLLFAIVPDFSVKTAFAPSFSTTPILEFSSAARSITTSAPSMTKLPRFRTTLPVLYRPYSLTFPLNCSEAPSSITNRCSGSWLLSPRMICWASDVMTTVLPAGTVTGSCSWIFFSMVIVPPSSASFTACCRVFPPSAIVSPAFLMDGTVYCTVTPSGKVPSTFTLSSLLSMVTVFRGQPSNALALISVRLGPIFAASIPAHPLNAESPSVFRLSGSFSIPLRSE